MKKKRVSKSELLDRIRDTRIEMETLKENIRWHYNRIYTIESILIAHGISIKNDDDCHLEKVT